MKYWQLISKSSLKLATVGGREPTDKEIRVKVDKVLLTPSDLLVYDERIPHPSPFVPGRFAIGTVCEGYGVNEAEPAPGSFRFKRNEKVLLRTYYRTEEEIPTTKGIHKNGFLRDFVYLTQNEIFHIPPTVAEEDSLFMGLLAFAEAAIDACKAEEGDFVLVCGEDILSVLICQLLLYYKIVPVLVTTTGNKVAIAKKLGVFYTYEIDETLRDNVFRITGGKMCDSAIYCNSMNRTSPSVAMNLLIYGANMVFAGACDRSWAIDSTILTNKALTISGIFSGYGYEHTALGILANRVIDFSKFDKAYESFDSLDAAYARLSKNFDNYHIEIVKIG